MDSGRIRLHFASARKGGNAQILVGPHRPVPARRIVRILLPKAIARQSSGARVAREKRIARAPFEILP